MWLSSKEPEWGPLKCEVEGQSPFCQGIRTVLAQGRSKEKPHHIGTMSWARGKASVVKRLLIVNTMYYSNTA